MSTSQSHTENELILRVASGEEAAFRILFHRYFRRLCFFAHSLIENMEDAKDIAQESLFQVWIRREYFDDAEKVKSFLYITTRNSSFNYIKASKRRSDRHQEIARLMEDDTDIIQTYIAREELLHKLLLELESVPPKYAGVLKMIFIQGLSHEKVAERLSIPIATVRKQKERGLKFLQAAVLRKKLAFFLLLYEGIIKK